MSEFSSQDRDLFRSGLRDLLSQRSDEQAVRALIDSADGVDRQLWLELVDGLGIAGLLVPEEMGGLGLGALEMQVLLEECAAALYSGPVLSTAVLAPTALLASGDAPGCEDYWPSIIAGELIVAVALDDENGAVQARQQGDGATLSGVKTAVIDGAIAGLLLVVAEDAEGFPGLYAVDPASGGVTLSPLDVLDRTRRQSRLVLADAPARRLGGDFSEGLERLRDVAATAAACEQVGVSQRALDLAVDYAKVREQFGKPIGSFQAIKHICAEMLVRVECMRSATTSAAKADTDLPARRSEAASVAKAYGSLAATYVTENLIQVLGGIGYTWEHPAHLYLRRAKTLQFSFGDAPYHRRRIARLHGIELAA